MLEKVAFGKTDLKVVPLCFGGNVFGWTIDEATSFRMLDAVVDAGLDFIDTADVYSAWAPGNKGGESETILGKWLKKSGKRGRLVIATKVGMELGPDKKGLAKDYIARAVEDSLRRLQIETIDLYQSHQDDEATPMTETLEAYAKLIQAGKVRAIGASNFTGARLREAAETSRKHGLPAYATLQPLYNLSDRFPFETDLAPACRELGLGVIPFYSLAAGFLTGKYRTIADLSQSVRGARTVERYMNPRGFRILAALDLAAKELGSKPASVAIAWLRSKSVVTAPIASATNLDQLVDLVAGLNLKLPPETLAALDGASKPE
jgi:aryl-alcohol dehydrogenase-like predicted oxidoreductase